MSGRGAKLIRLAARSERAPAVPADACAAAITVAGVTKVFRRKTLTTAALDGIDLAIRKGRFLRSFSPAPATPRTGGERSP